MAHNRSGWFASPNKSNSERHPLLKVVEEREDDDTIIDLSHPEATNHFYDSDDIEYLSSIEVDAESGEEEIDPFFNAANDARDSFLLKIELLRSVQDEFLAHLESAEKSFRLKKRYSHLAFGTGVITAGVLILLTGILAGVIPSMRYKKVAGIFEANYNAAPIPNQLGGGETCHDLGFSLISILKPGNKSTLTTRLNMGNPRQACELIEFKNSTYYDEHLEANFLGNSSLAMEASHVCLAVLLGLCDEFNKTFYSKNSYLYLIIAAPICLAFLSLFLILGGYASIPGPREASFNDLDFSDHERKRVLATMDVFDISLSSEYQPVDELKTEMKAKLEHIDNFERSYFTEKYILPKKMQGQHAFFSTLVGMAIPDAVKMTKDEVEHLGDKAYKAGLLR